MDEDIDRRLIFVERGLATLEARMDSRFDGLSRQVNGISDRFDDAATQAHIHTANHHGKGTVIRQGGLTAAAATLLVFVVELLRQLIL